MRRALSRHWSFGALFALWLYPQCANAQAALSAREHYAAGLKLVAAGDVDAAVREFEAAYRISPNAAVLYNLGQAYLELGEPVRALEAFQGYLRGGQSLTPERQREVSALLALCKRRVGRLTIAVEPVVGEVFVDGRSMGNSPLSSPVALAVGTHEVSVDASGFTPFIARVTIAPDGDASLNARLEPAPQPTPEVAVEQGQLALSCDVPETTIAIDGKPVPIIGSEPVILRAGPHSVSWSRVGYQSTNIQVEIRNGRVEPGACDLLPEPKLSAQDSGILELSLSQSGSRVQIDGRPSAAIVRLPLGPHSVVVRHPGYLDWSQLLNVEPARGQRVRVVLVPTAEHAARVERAQRRKTWAYALGGAGLAFLGGSAALYVDNGRRYRNWEHERDALTAAVSEGADASSLVARTSRVREDSVSIQRRDDLAAGIGIVGIGLVSYAIVSWLTTEP